MSLLLMLAISVANPALDDSEALVNALRDAQRTNEARFPRGELRAIVTLGQTGALSLRDNYDIAVAWDGPKIRTSSVQWRGDRPISEAKGTAPEEWICDQTRSILYGPPQGRAWIRSIAEESQPIYAGVSPNSFWYGRLGGIHASWSEWLNPKFNPRVAASGVRYSAKRVGEDRVEVLRESDRRSSFSRAIFSLAEEGNVVEYETVEDTTHTRIKGSCRWGRDARGLIYLAEMEERMLCPTKDGPAEVFRLYKTTEFHPEMRPDPKRFLIESMIKPGTIVSDSIRKRDYRYGERPIDDVTKALPGLIDLMKSRGFSGGRSK